MMEKFLAAALANSDNYLEVFSFDRNASFW